MNITSEISTVEVRAAGDVSEKPKVYTETLNSTVESISGYIERWNDVRGAVYSPKSSRLLYSSWIAKALTEDESRSKYVSTKSTDLGLFYRVNRSLENIYAADAVATFDATKSRSAIRLAVDVVEDAIEEGDLASLDELFSKADPRYLRKITSVALLRTSFRVKSKVSKWNRFYSEVFAHLSNTEQDPHHALRGMVKG